MKRIVFLSVSILILTFVAFSQVTELEKIQRHIDEVAQKIWNAASNNIKMPQIITTDMNINPNDSYTFAYYSPLGQKIYFSKGLYYLCMSIGEEALAAVLAHELGHYYYLHTSYYTTSGFFVSSSERKLIDQETIDSSKICETQADLFAIHKCYLAGYDVQDAFPNIIDTIYKIQNLPDETPFYLTRTERMGIARKASSLIDTLIPLYEISTFLHIIGKYDLAAFLFDYIAEQFLDTWDINLNSGINYALAFYQSLEPRFIYPFQLSINSIISSRSSLLTTKRLPSTYSPTLNFFSEAAENRFRKALDKNPNNSLAKIYYACLKHIVGDTSGAINLINHIDIERNDTLKLFQYCIAKAIINSYNLKTANETLNYASFWEFSIFNDSTITQLNRLALNKGDISSYNFNIKTFEGDSSGKFIYERISSYSPYSKNIPFNKVTMSPGRFRPSFDLKYLIADSYKAYQIDDYVILATLPNYEGKTELGCSIGSPIDDSFKKKYGFPPTRVVPFHNSLYYVYENKRIAFKIENGKIAGWFLFNSP